ncbi:pseudouridine-5'-phosphatase [Nephila pilipes]|uniref:Pseudouridine-5'-phosphatase n=1 Tax=Nephila pilipes TaxID=299642 RepID=A0A8X6NVW7_NEPPI|nr:pseudouridine-5'-phosphatase [Nephila pilipes]
MATFKPVTHVIFDMDGLIFDTEDIYTEMHQTIANRELDIPMTVEEFHSEFAKMSNEMFLKTKVLPGVKRLISHLHANKVPIAIATSSKKETFDVKTTHHQDLIGLFHHVVCGSSDPEVKSGKPAPDVFLVCAKRFDDEPALDKVLVFEDAPNGVQAAVTAGMQVVMVPDPRLEKEHCKLATLVLSSMKHFQPELFGLPPFPKD